jgi:hypothetical protein
MPSGNYLKWTGCFVCSSVFWIALVSVNAADEMRVAVSIRYLEIKGTSHATFIASAAEKHKPVLDVETTL